MNTDVEAYLLDSLDGNDSNHCAVVSVYEDSTGRDLLVRLCNSLSWKFKGDLDFKFDWWRFKYLSDPEMGLAAAHTAAHADLILLAPGKAKLPKYVEGWLEEWVPSRISHDGALVLVQPQENGKSSRVGLGSYLRQTAHRGHLDYFTLESPLPASDVAPAQLQLVELLYQSRPPMHWGINE